MPAHSNKTELKNRTLWYDGDNTVSEGKLLELLSKRASLDGIFVSEITKEIAQYNALVPKEHQVNVKTDIREPNLCWNLPDLFSSLDVRKYVLNCLEQRIIADKMTTNNIRDRIQRTLFELDLYENAGLFDVLRALIYIINTLQVHNVVWGVGRGSSVASYVLYLIGVHDVDSIEYGLDITEFLRSNDINRKKQHG